MTIQLPDTDTRGPADPSRFQTYDQWGRRWYTDTLPGVEMWPATTDQYPAVSTLKKAWQGEFVKKLPSGAVVPLDAHRVALYAVTETAWRKEEPDDAVEILAAAAKADLERASERGTDVHSILEALTNGREPHVSPDAAPYVDACKRWLDDVQPEVVHTEIAGINRTAGGVGYGGACDLYAKIEGEFGPVDYKSRSATSKHACYTGEAVQVGGAYARFDYLLREVVTADGPVAVRWQLAPCAGGWIVSLKPDGTYAQFPVEADPAFTALERLIETWKAKKDGEHHARKAIGKPRIVQPQGDPVLKITPATNWQQPPEGDEITDADREAMERRIEALGTWKHVLNGWAKEAIQAGRSFHMKEHRTVRRHSIARAACECIDLLIPTDDKGGAFTFDDVRCLIASVMADDSALFPTVTLGACLGSLSIDEANTLAERAYGLGHGSLPIRYDAAGILRVA